MAVPHSTAQMHILKLTVEIWKKVEAYSSKDVAQGLYFQAV